MKDWRKEWVEPSGEKYNRKYWGQGRWESAPEVQLTAPAGRNKGLKRVAASANGSEEGLAVDWRWAHSGFPRPGQSLCTLVCFVSVSFQFCIAPGGQERLALGAGAAPKAAATPPAENQSEKDDEAPEDTLDSVGTWKATVMTAESIEHVLACSSGMLGYIAKRRVHIPGRAAEGGRRRAGRGSTSYKSDLPAKSEKQRAWSGRVNSLVGVRGL